MTSKTSRIFVTYHYVLAHKEMATDYTEITQEKNYINKTVKISLKISLKISYLPTEQGNFPHQEHGKLSSLKVPIVILTVVREE